MKIYYAHPSKKVRRRMKDEGHTQQQATTAYAAYT